jgi:hypothetical protein
MNKLTAAAIFLLLAGAAKAQPLDVDFSIFDSNGNGTLTGELVFANSGTDVQAEDAYIYTAPASFISETDLPMSFTQANSFGGYNSFDISASGIISSALFAVANSQIELAFNSSVGYYEAINVSDHVIANNTISTSLVTVPEPSSVAILGAAMLGLAMLRRRLQA